MMDPFGDFASAPAPAPSSSSRAATFDADAEDEFFGAGSSTAVRAPVYPAVPAGSVAATVGFGGGVDDFVGAPTTAATAAAASPALEVESDIHTRRSGSEHTRPSSAVFAVVEENDGNSGSRKGGHSAAAPEGVEAPYDDDFVGAASQQQSSGSNGDVHTAAMQINQDSTVEASDVVRSTDFFAAPPPVASPINPLPGSGAPADGDVHDSRVEAASRASASPKANTAIASGGFGSDDDEFVSAPQSATARMAEGGHQSGIYTNLALDGESGAPTERRMSSLRPSTGEDAPASQGTSAHATAIEAEPVAASSGSANEALAPVPQDVHWGEDADSAPKASATPTVPAEASQQQFGNFAGATSGTAFDDEDEFVAAPKATLPASVVASAAASDHFAASSSQALRADPAVAEVLATTPVEKTEGWSSSRAAAGTAAWGDDDADEFVAAPSAAVSAAAAPRAPPAGTMPWGADDGADDEFIAAPAVPVSVPQSASVPAAAPYAPPSNTVALGADDGADDEFVAAPSAPVSATVPTSAPPAGTTVWGAGDGGDDEFVAAPSIPSASTARPQEVPSSETGNTAWGDDDTDFISAPASASAPARAATLSSAAPDTEGSVIPTPAVGTASARNAFLNLSAAQQQTLVNLDQFFLPSAFIDDATVLSAIDQHVAAKAAAQAMPAEVEVAPLSADLGFEPAGFGCAHDDPAWADGFASALLAAAPLLDAEQLAAWRAQDHSLPAAGTDNPLGIDFPSPTAASNPTSPQGSAKAAWAEAASRLIPQLGMNGPPSNVTPQMQEILSAYATTSRGALNGAASSDAARPPVANVAARRAARNAQRAEVMAKPLRIKPDALPPPVSGSFFGVTEFLRSLF